MIQPVLNHFIIQIDRKFDDIKNGKIVDTRGDPSEHVTNVGRIVSVPLGFSNTDEYRGYNAKYVRAGDMCIFRYDVIFNYKLQPERDSNVYTNLIFWKGKEYWKVHVHQMYAFIRDGDIFMMNGYVMASWPDDTMKSLIYLNQAQKNLQSADSVIVQFIGHNLGHLKDVPVAPGDRVLVHPGRLVKYTVGIEGKEFCIFRQSHILGVDL
jgi:co-chaperonin GroES (HSP10)